MSQQKLVVQMKRVKGGKWRIRSSAMSVDKTNCLTPLHMRARGNQWTCFFFNVYTLLGGLNRSRISRAGSLHSSVCSWRKMFATSCVIASLSSLPKQSWVGTCSWVPSESDMTRAELCTFSVYEVVRERKLPHTVKVPHSKFTVTASSKLLCHI